MEDLDVESARLRWPWEWIGAGLVLGIVLSVAVGGWWQSAQVADTYRHGVAAAAARHWAAAATAFHAAGTWQDAPLRAAQADGQVQRLGALYAQGQAAAAQADWPAATQAFSEAVGIAPDYQDVATQVARARQELRRTGLAGLVVLRVAGAQPGLYLQSSDVYLTGSGANSRVRAIAADGRRFIYDQEPALPPGASFAVGPTPTPPADFWIPFHGLAQTRPAVLVTLDATGGPTFTPLPPLIDGNGVGVFLGDVLWWYTHRGDFGYYSYAINYYDLRSGANGLIAGPSGGVQPVAWRADGSRVALAEYESVPPGASPRARIYLTDARATSRTLVGEVDGLVTSAAFNADGQHLFFLTAAKGSTTHTLYLLDLAASFAANREPEIQMAEGWSTPSSANGGMVAAWLGAQPNLLIDTWVAGDEHLEVYHPEILDGPISTGAGTSGLWTALWHGPTHPDIPDVAAIVPDGQTLAWRARPPAGPDQLVILTPGGQQRAIPLTTDTDRALEFAFAPHSDYLLYGGRALDSRQDARQAPVWSVPVAAGPPVYLGERAWDVQLPSLALPAAGTVVALVNTKHELHAVTYDGQVDLRVADGVAAVWNLHTPLFSGWAH